MAHKRTQQQSASQEAELEDRRALMLKARTGDTKAQGELMALYGVRLYSGTERRKTQVQEPSRASKMKNRVHRRP
jgi:hypothetical protein